MAEKARLYQVRLNSGGYEYGKYGKYYGHGDRLYRLITKDDQIEFRACNRAQAKKIAIQKYPEIKLYK